MNLKILNKNRNLLEVQLECRQCHKEYKFSFDDLYKVPIWKFENCSKECALKESEEKFLILRNNNQSIRTE